ncbi:MAG: hypothetical protein KJO43_01505 [Phycisphaerae bacterium]|nr:hypothetical protein [Phycisphaerae bacterium]
MAKRSAGRTIVWLLGLGVLVLVVVVALLPTLINRGLARGRFTAAIERQVDATATIDGLDLSWFGPQRIEGLHLVDADGREAAVLDLQLDSTLFPIILGTVKRYDLAVAGVLTGELRDDGTTSFHDLTPTPEPAASGDGAPAPSPKPASDALVDLDGVLPMAITVDGVTVDLAFPGSTTTAGLVLSSVAGQFVYEPGGATILELRSPVVSEGESGSFEFAATGRNLFDASGRMTPDGATLDATLTARRIPVPYAETPASIDTLEVRGVSTDLTTSLTLDLNLKTELEGEEPSVLTGDLAVRAPLTTGGGLNVGLDSVTGTVTGARVPTAIMQPLLAGSPIVLSRDVGPAVDVTARFEAPESDASDRQIDLDVTAAHARVALAARVAPDGAVRGEDARAQFNVQPALLENLTDFTMTRPTRVQVHATSFAFPARNADGTLPVNAIAVTGKVAMPGTAVVREVGAASDASPIAFEAIEVTVESPALGERVRVGGSGKIAGGVLEIDQTLTKLFDASGDLALGTAHPSGRIRLHGVDGAAVATLAERWVESSAARTAIRTLAGDAVGVVVSTSPSDEELRIALDVRTSRLTLETESRRRANELHVASLVAMLTATPELLAAFATDEPLPVTLTDAATVTLRTDPFTLPATADGGYELPAEPLKGGIRVADMTLTHESLTLPVTVSTLTGRVETTLGERPIIVADGNAELRGADVALGQMTYDVKLQTGETSSVSGMIGLDGVSVATLESVAGLTAGMLSGWIGDRGALAVRLDDAEAASELALDLNFEQLTGVARVAVTEDRLTATADTLALQVDATLLESWLNPAPEETSAEATGAAADPVRVTGPVPLTARLRTLDVPLALAKGAPFDPASVRLQTQLEGGPLGLATTAGPFSTVRDLTVTAGTSNLADGLVFKLGATVDTPDASDAGRIDVSGTVVGLVADDGTLDTDGAKLEMEANSAKVPTVLADALLGFNRALVAAVGPEMKATFRARNFSAETGYLEARIDTAQGFLEGRIRGRRGDLRTVADYPVRGALTLTPAFRRQLLTPLNPILQDVRTTAQPIEFAITSNALIPLDGNLRRMKADLQIGVGAVEFDSGSAFLGVLALFNDSPKRTIPGRIDPIVARIRRGVVEYDQFSVQLGKYTLRYQGTVDLVTKKVDLRTELPLEALALTFEELAGYVDKITVPLVTTGTIGDIKTDVDPSFDLAGAAAEAGFRGALNELLEGKGVKLGDLLGDLIGGAKSDG